MTEPDEPPESGGADDAALPVTIGELVSLWSDSAIFMEIGLRAEAMRLDPGRAFAAPLAPAPRIDGKPAFPGLETLGERLVHRLERQIEELVGGGETVDDLDRQRLLSASAHRCPIVAATAIAPALVAGFGLAPPIAPLAAAALCRRGSPARWSAISARRGAEVQIAIERLALPK